MNTVETLANAGIHFTAGQHLLDCDADGVVNDAALQSAVNVAMPDFFATYVFPGAIETLTAKRTATDLFREVKAGEFEDEGYVFATTETVGHATAYSDFNGGTTTSVNSGFQEREIARHQTLIQVGDLEARKYARAKLDLLGLKQKGAAEILAIRQNEIYWRGVVGKKIYGILNDPNLPEAIAPKSGTTWDKKDAIGIYTDILAMFSAIMGNAAGHVTKDSPMTLALTPDRYMTLFFVTPLGVSPIMELLTKWFPNLRIVNSPELKTSTTQTAMLIVDEIAGVRTGECAMIDRLVASDTVRRETSFSQKWSAANGGFKLNRPFGVCIMNGI